MTSVGVPPSSIASIDAPRSSILINSNERPVVVDKKTRVKPPAVRIIPIPIRQTQSNSSNTRSNISTSPTARSDHNDPEGTTSPGVASPCIRFAPLPDPHRPRSLSTGRNLGLRAGEGPNGEREYTLELRNMGSGDDFDNALDDEDSKSSEEGDEEMDDDDDYDWERDSGRRRSWAVSMGSKGMGSMSSAAWTGTKKLVGLKPDSGMKKSGSASSFGTSPNTQASSFLSPGRRGSTASTGSNNSSHKRSGSSDSKPSQPAKMLNGRVYGARRASEAAAMERMRRERNEPAFVEWGNTGAVGSNSAAPASRSLGSRSAFDDDDGGGMAWVRKRREERERKAREDAEAAASGQSTGLAPPADVDASNPGMSPAHRPESLSSASSASSHGGARGPTGPLTPNDAATELADGTFASFAGFDATAKRSESLGMAPDATAYLPKDQEAEHHLHSVRIPTSRFRRRSGDDDYEEEDDDDGDFEPDEDDEEELISQKCAAAAGIEVVARHH